MNWKHLNTEAQLEQIREESHRKPVVLFKHSTRCNISSTAKSRLERQYSPNAGADVYLLDLISFRNVSNRIASEFGVRHESPQVLVIKDGLAVHHASHMDIAWSAVEKAIEASKLQLKD